MVIFIVILTLVASFLSALSAVIQRRVAGKPHRLHLFRRSYIERLMRNKLWLMAAGMQLISFLLRAAALSQGSMVLIAPLMTSDLLFLLLIMHFRHKITVGTREWIAAAGICTGLSALFFLSRPHEGSRAFTNSPWILVVGAIVIVLIATIFFVRRSPSSRYRALLSGIGSGLTYSAVALFSKISAATLLDHGAIALLSSWGLYALIVAGVTSFFIQQNTYGAGPLAVSQPAMEISEPITSVVIGVLIFGDTIALGLGTIAGEAIATVVIIASIVVLSRSENLYKSQL